MRLAEIKPRQTENSLHRSCSPPVDQVLSDPNFDFVSWDIFGNWKERNGNQFGAGSPSPSIPRSERQYDGDNYFEYCEVLSTR